MGERAGSVPGRTSRAPLTHPRGHPITTPWSQQWDAGLYPQNPLWESQFFTHPVPIHLNPLNGLVVTSFSPIWPSFPQTSQHSSVGPWWMWTSHHLQHPGLGARSSFRDVRVQGGTQAPPSRAMGVGPSLGRGKGKRASGGSTQRRAEPGEGQVRRVGTGLGTRGLARRRDRQWEAQAGCCHRRRLSPLRPAGTPWHHLCHHAATALEPAPLSPEVRESPRGQGTGRLGDRGSVGRAHAQHLAWAGGDAEGGKVTAGLSPRAPQPAGSPKGRSRDRKAELAADPPG